MDGLKGLKIKFCFKKEILFVYVLVDYVIFFLQSVLGVVEMIKVIIKKKLERIVKFVFDYVIKYKRQKVIVVYKVNIMQVVISILYNRLIR